MSYANYSEIEHKVADHEAFDSGNRSAVNNLDKEYVVSSYSTAIGRWTPKTGYRINNKHYSQTTNRLQSILKRAWTNPTIVNDEAALYA